MGSYPKITPIIATGSSKPRYLGDRFADIVNLKDFGAAGDGETDDSTAWAAWRTALQSGGMPYIPAGDYALGETGVHVPDGFFGCKAVETSYNDSWPVLKSFTCSIYVSPDGDDDNDGLTEETPVETIEKAYALASSKPLHGESVAIVFDAGSYTEDITITDSAYTFLLNGNVSIIGDINITNSRVKIGGDSYTLTVVGDITIYNNSNVFIGASSITQTGHTFVQQFSSLVLSGALTITGSTTYVLRVLHNSSVIIQSTLTATNTGTYTTISCEQGSYINVYGSTSITQNGGSSAIGAGNAATIVFDNSVSIGGTNIYRGISAGNYSFVVVGGDVNMTAAATNRGVLLESGSFKCFGNVTLRSAGRVMDVEYASYCQIAKILELYGGGSSNTDMLYLDSGSVFLGYGSSLKLAPGNNGSNNGVRVLRSSVCVLSYSAMRFDNSYSNAVVTSQGNSIIAVNSGATMSGSATGKRYSVENGAQITVGGKGANFIPGSVAGTASSSQYAYYG